MCQGVCRTLQGLGGRLSGETSGIHSNACSMAFRCPASHPVHGDWLGKGWGGGGRRCPYAHPQSQGQGSNHAMQLHMTPGAWPIWFRSSQGCQGMHGAHPPGPSTASGSQELLLLKLQRPLPESGPWEIRQSSCAQRSALPSSKPNPSPHPKPDPILELSPRRRFKGVSGLLTRCTQRSQLRCTSSEAGPKKVIMRDSCAWMSACCDLSRPAICTCIGLQGRKRQVLGADQRGLACRGPDS